MVADLVDRCDPPARARLLALVAAARLDAPVLVDTSALTSMVEPFAWFVRHVGIDGRPLTAQGYLKPADVTAVAEHLRLDDEWIGTVNRESLTPAVAEFRTAAMRTGLLRVAKGRIHAWARGQRWPTSLSPCGGNSPTGSPRHARTANVAPDSSCSSRWPLAPTAWVASATS